MLEKAELFADAISEGERVDKIAMTLQAESEAAACEQAFAIAQLDPSLGVCVAETIEAGTGRSSGDHHVTMLLSAATVDAPALESALEKLADEGVTTMTTQIDPAAALEASVPDESLETLEPLLETFEAEARAIVEAEKEEAKIQRRESPRRVIPRRRRRRRFPAPRASRASGAPLESETTLLSSVPAPAVAEATLLSGRPRRGRGGGEGVHDGPGGVGGGGVRGGVRDDAARLEPRGVLGGARRGAPAALSSHPSPPDAGGERAALASYHVTILLRGDVVDAMALESALVHLAAEGVTTMTTEVDPATELEAIPGVDEALVEAFEEEVEAAAPRKPSRDRDDHRGGPRGTGRRWPRPSLRPRRSRARPRFSRRWPRRRSTRRTAS